MFRQMSQEYRSTLTLESWDRSFTQEENENLCKQSVGEPIKAMAIEKGHIKRSRLGIVVHHPIDSMAGITRQYLQWRVT